MPSAPQIYCAAGIGACSTELDISRVPAWDGKCVWNEQRATWMRSYTSRTLVYIISDAFEVIITYLSNGFLGLFPGQQLPLVASRILNEGNDSLPAFDRACIPCDLPTCSHTSQRLARLFWSKEALNASVLLTQQIPCSCTILLLYHLHRAALQDQSHSVAAHWTKSVSANTMTLTLTALTSCASIVTFPFALSGLTCPVAPEGSLHAILGSIWRFSFLCRG